MTYKNIFLVVFGSVIMVIIVGGVAYFTADRDRVAIAADNLGIATHKESNTLAVPDTSFRATYPNETTTQPGANTTKPQTRKTTSPGTAIKTPSPSPTPPASAKDIPWTSYMGVQYTPRSYTTGIRDVGQAHKYGYNAADPAQSYANFVSFVIPEVNAKLADHLALTLQVGGLGSGKSNESTKAYLDAVTADNAASAIDGYYKRAKAVAEIQGTKDKIHWQIGNEINAASFSSGVHAWLADGVTPRAHDVSIIPTLVEYFIAPAIVGIEKASQEVHGASGNIQIMLGSIAAGANPNAQTFLNTLLDYQITGTYAPSLAGKRIYELIDTVSIHYLMSGPGLTWKTNLDKFLATRIGQGRIQRIFSTEEVGISAANSNTGVSSALITLSRYLSWWQANDILPDIGRVFFYGNNAGQTTIDNEFPLLLAFTGINPLAEILDNKAAFVAGANLEKYEFKVGTEKKRVLIGFSADTNSTSLSSMTFTEEGWNKNKVSVTAYQYGGSLSSSDAGNPGRLTLTPTVTALGGGQFKIDFGSVTLVPKSVLLLMIESN